METKPIYQSKTFWLAVAQAVAGIITIFASTYDSVGWLIIAKSAVDTYMRYVTTTAVK